MVDPAVIPASRNELVTNAGLKVLIAGLLAYWGACALLLPVTTSDSHVYNLARLLITERAGFWQSAAWNSVRQVIFPWTFDAVHYLFLKLGWGTALPSFLEFVALLVIVYQLVAPRFGSQAALWSILTLFSMPTIMLQATTSKNDIAVVFGVGCWLLALVRYQRSLHWAHLFTAALSLAFLTGAKSSGLPILIVLVLVTAWQLRNRRRGLLVFTVFLAPLLLLFGSIETYYLTWRTYGRLPGPEQFVRDSVNRDGIRGGAANFVRYCATNCSLGIDGVDCRSGLTGFLEGQCRFVLAGLHLQNAGYRRDLNDGNLLFLKDGFDSGSDYGLVGWLMMLGSAWTVLRPRINHLAWGMSVCGWLAVGLTCLSLCWTPWNVRFLCLSLMLFGVSQTILIFSGYPAKPFWQPAVLGTIILWSAFGLPLHCGQRQPLDLWNSVAAREQVMFRQRLEVRPAYQEVLRLRAGSAAPWFLVAGENAWTLPFLMHSELAWQFTPRWDQAAAALRDAHTEGEAYALVLNTALPTNLPFELVKSFPLSTYIIRLKSAGG